MSKIRVPNSTIESFRSKISIGLKLQLPLNDIQRIKVNTKKLLYSKMMTTHKKSSPSYIRQLRQGENQIRRNNTATLKRHLATKSYYQKSFLFKNDEHTQKFKSFVHQGAEIAKFSRFSRVFFNFFFHPEIGQTVTRLLPKAHSDIFRPFGSGTHDTPMD